MADMVLAGWRDASMRDIGSSAAGKYHIALDGIPDATCSRSIALIEETLKEGMLLAWGVHEPSVFLAACAAWGVSSDALHRVKHERYIKGRNRKGYDAWYEPVKGEPNATVLLP